METHLYTREKFYELCCSNPEKATELFLALSTALKMIEERVKQLEQQQNQNSQNSNKPPFPKGSLWDERWF
jgi:hypothetical protein